MSFNGALQKMFVIFVHRTYMQFEGVAVGSVSSADAVLFTLAWSVAWVLNSSIKRGS